MKKFSSYSKKKKVGCSCCILLMVMVVGTFIAVPIFISLLEVEIIRDVTTINSDGTAGKAFVAYRPGLSDFQEDITNGFIQGLEENGWYINVTTLSSQTPTNLCSYDLLVFGSPTYGGLPHDSVGEYFKRTQNFNGKDVVLIVSAGGTDTALLAMQEMVESKNGVVIESLILYIQNVGAREVCYQSAKSLN